MAKNFNLKVKNSQLAAVLKQKELKGSKKATTKAKAAEKKADAAVKEVEGEPKKVVRKAKAGPSVIAPKEELTPEVKEELIHTELADDTPAPAATEDVAEESVAEAKEEL
ncbi:hypothetical protein K0U07_04305, partial [bacterium]|nr:hypothetical protein [bacterium]